MVFFLRASFTGWIAVAWLLLVGLEKAINAVSSVLTQVLASELVFPRLVQSLSEWEVAKHSSHILTLDPRSSSQTVLL